MNSRKTIYGVGVNDADYNVTKYEVIEGKKVQTWACPFYSRWVGMIKRCYMEKWLLKYPSYKGCEVCKEWLTFSNFKAWMLEQDWKGKELDKDILRKGNKTYSPDFCVFIPKIVNTFLNDNKKRRGSHSLGVYKPTRGRFQAQCHNPFTGKIAYVGRFDTNEEAHIAWKSKKHEFACCLVAEHYVDDPRVIDVLLSRYA